MALDLHDAMMGLLGGVQIGLAEAWLGLGDTERANSYLTQADNRLGPNDPIRREPGWQR